MESGMVPQTLVAPDGHRKYLSSPIVRHDLWDWYKLMLASFWTVEEVDLSRDKADFDKLSVEAQYCLKNVLAFFAVADGVVVSNLMDNFAQEVTVIEGKFAYLTQNFMEAIHSEMYSQLIETIVPLGTERAELLNSAVTSAHIATKTEFAMKYMGKGRPFAERLVAFCVVEGVLFSSSFAFIYWMKTKGLMPGLCFSNELIARDEGMHRDFGIHIYNTDCTKLPKEVIHGIVREGVDIEKTFVRECLGKGLLGLSSTSMCQYVEFVADHLLHNMDGVDAIYNVKNPLHFMELISLQGKTNFFEKRVGEYSKTNVAPAREGSEQVSKGHELVFGDLDF